MKKIYRTGDNNLPAEIKKLFEKALNNTQYFEYKMEVKALKPDAPLDLTGIANQINPDRGKEVIEPDAWDLSNYMKNPIILYEHDYKCPIGYCTSIEIKDDGLHYTARIGDPQSAPLTQIQIDVRSLLAQGILKANSVGFLPHEIEYDEDNDIIRYTKAELLEISVVAVPMQQDSLITNIKSLRETQMASAKTKDEQDGQTGEPAQGDSKPNAAIQDSLDSMHKKMDDMYKKMDEVHAMCKAMGEKPGDSANDQEPDGDADDSKKNLKAKVKELEDKLAASEAEKKSMEDATDALLASLKKTGVVK